ncbi:MAG: hypothetical protein K6G34_08285 [Lachnospiraceae bacterium]|nr:hypothetical protein [Lachnospiraceae bacterium]
MKHSLVPGGSSGELTTKSFSTATTFADLLLEEEYVVMLSREEDLYVINYIWSERGADRNDVVFMDRCDFEECFCEIEDEDEEEEYDAREKKYEREKQMGEYQCEGQYVMEEFDDQST